MKFMEKYGSLIGMIVVAMVMIIAIYYAYQLMMDAGATYVSAKKDTSGFTASTTQTNQQVAQVSDTPLGGFIPGA
jgi:uncharacterized protein YxeA